MKIRFKIYLLNRDIIYQERDVFSEERCDIIYEIRMISDGYCDSGALLQTEDTITYYNPSHIVKVEVENIIKPDKK